MAQQHKIGDSRVIESRESADGKAIRRRRESTDGRRFTTYERIERRALVVVKRDGTHDPYDRDKLFVAVHRSVGKFFKSETEIDDIVSRIEDAIYELGEHEVSSKKIGEMVLSVLSETNMVAYVRFASVFLDFRTLDDFVKILKREDKEIKD